MVKSVLICVLLLTLISCATTGESMSKIELGMSKQDVVGVLGSPDGSQSTDGYEVMKYSPHLTSVWSWYIGNYFVILKNDEVVEYGAGEVRERNVDGAHILFIDSK
jgi:hypothetical protein